MTDLLIRTFIKNADDINDPLVRSRYGALSGGAGIVLNILLFVMKLVLGFFTASVAITADAFNNLSDAGSSVVMLVGFKLSAAPADKAHPFGHGRIEYISGFLISVAIMILGVEFIKTSWERIMEPAEVSISAVTLVILAASVILKLWMYAFNRKLGGRINSGAMKTAAADALSDAAATAAVLIGTVAGHYAGVPLDGYLGIAVAAFILFTGFNTARENVSSMIGAPPDGELVGHIREEAAAFPEILGIHDLVVHNYGPGHVMISFHAEVACDGDIIKLHEAIDALENRLREKYGAVATIHMDPIVTDDKYTSGKKAEAERLVSAIDERLTIHDFRVVRTAEYTRLVFDVLMPYEFKMTPGELETRIEAAVREADPACRARVHAEHSYISAGGAPRRPLHGILRREPKNIVRFLSCGLVQHIPQWEPKRISFSDTLFLKTLKRLLLFL
ncbi:MAG: cation transporter [Clostridia bacterium]|nr:cation transporter [Clostridia bacterium]